MTTINYLPYRERAYALAEERIHTSRRQGLTSRNMTRHDQRTIEASGIVGEVAVCLWLGLDPEEHIHTGRPDDGYDIALPNGRTIAVKTRTERGRDYLIPAFQLPLKADYAMLVWPGETKGTADIVGWLARWEHEHLRAELVQKGIEPGTWIVPWGMFRSPETFNWRQHV